MTAAVIALGSNLGDREANLRSAVAAIADLGGVAITGASGIVESRALKPDGVDAAAPSTSTPCCWSTAASAPWSCSTS